MKRDALRWFAVVVAVEILSALTIFQPLANSIACVVIGLIVFWLAWKKPTIGAVAMVLELLIGSKGYLLQLGTWPQTISLRIVMTAAFGLGWFIGFIQRKGWTDLLKLFAERKAYLVLFIAIGYTTIRGLLLHNEFVFQDANAWADWALLFPALEISWYFRDRIRRDVVPVFFVGVVWLAIKSFGVEYLFAHGFSSIGANAYLWIRRTGVGEITQLSQNAFRVFMQSYIYAVPALIACVTYWFTTKGWNRTTWRVIVAASFILILSLSRSFWIGTAAGLLTSVVLLSREHVRWWKRLWGPMSGVLLGLILVITSMSFPLPPVKIGSFIDLFTSRINTDEAAAVSRWQMLPALWSKIEEHPILGSGFGATVTYQSKDPRIIALYPNGVYTTYAFEWGWLEHWIKFGIIGIPLILFLLWSLGRRLWKLNEPLWLKTAAISSLVALAVTHIFTPYLNHPLGFLFFFIGEGIVLSSPTFDKHAVSR